MPTPMPNAISKKAFQADFLGTLSPISSLKFASPMKVASPLSFPFEERMIERRKDGVVAEHHKKQKGGEDKKEHISGKTLLASHRPAWEHHSLSYQKQNPQQRPRNILFPDGHISGCTCIHNLVWQNLAVAGEAPLRVFPDKPVHLPSNRLFIQKSYGFIQACRPCQKTLHGTVHHIVILLCRGFSPEQDGSLLQGFLQGCQNGAAGYSGRVRPAG